MEGRLLFKAVRLALGTGRPPPSAGAARAIHTGHRPPATLLGRLFQRVLPQTVHHAPPPSATQPFTYRGVHTQRSNLSLPARHFIQQNTAKSLHCVPRPPMPSRGIQQVGLGKARNFSTASPLFHTGVKNVPIVVRAFAQADLDLKSSVADGKVKAARKVKGKKTARALQRLAAIDNMSVSSASVAPEEMEHYFADTTPAVLTQVTISLEPVRHAGSASPEEFGSPTSSGVDSDTEFWDRLADIHALYRPHMRRVESLIRRLEPYAHLRRNEDVLGWSSYPDEEGLPIAIRFAFAATLEEVQAWLGDFATARWLSVEDVTPGQDRLFASLNTDLEQVWNEGSVFPDPMAASHSPAAVEVAEMGGSLTALPEWSALPATRPQANTPPDEYLTDLGEAWSGFSSQSEEWEYDSQPGEEDDDVLSEPDSVYSVYSLSSGPELQFSAQFQRRVRAH